MKFPKYNNTDTCKDQILSDNQNKSGIYMWTNNINNKKYIGSSESLRARFYKYFNQNHLLENNCMNICKALIKHDYSNFSLTILEYCDKDKCIEREDFYLSSLPHEYNILEKAGSRLGSKHSDDTKKILSEANKGEKNPNYGQKVEGSGKPSQAIEVTDITNNITTSYNSISEAARVLNIHKSVIDNYFSRNQTKPYKGKYTFIKTKQN